MPTLGARRGFRIQAAAVNDAGLPPSAIARTGACAKLLRPWMEYALGKSNEGRPLLREGSNFGSAAAARRIRSETAKAIRRGQLVVVEEDAKDNG